MNIIVYTNTGQTYLFQEIEDFSVTTTGFKFSYLGKATGIRSTAVFNNTSTSGYAMQPRPEE